MKTRANKAVAKVAFGALALNAAFPALAFAAEAEQEGGISAILPDMAEFIPMLIAFIILWIILAKFGWPMFAGMLEKRENTIREALKKSEEAQIESERVLAEYNKQLADAKGRSRDFEYYNTIERLAPQVIAEKRHIYKGVSTNVDFYSGFVYDMLGIPVELYTPIFAVARIVGWSAHRMEELVNVDKIIRPAYQSIMQTREYVPLEER